MNFRRGIALFTACATALVASSGNAVDAQSKSGAASNEWPTYGHDPGGKRFSPLTQLTPGNVGQLEVAWVYHMRPAPTPRRIAVLAAWDGGGDVETRWAEALGQLCAGAREHRHVEAELVRAALSEAWKDWVPDVTDARPLDPG